MADEFGNYQAAMGETGPEFTPIPGVPIIIGGGPPNSSTQIAPIYINSSTGDLYTNGTLKNDGWALVSGGGGSSSVTHGHGTPLANGVSPITYKIYINDNNGALWAVAAGAWYQVTADSEA